MGALLLYILKSTICLILFYLGFKALLSNDTFFRTFIDTTADHSFGKDDSR